MQAFFPRDPADAIIVLQDQPEVHMLSILISIKFSYILLPQWDSARPKVGWGIPFWSSSCIMEMNFFYVSKLLPLILTQRTRCYQTVCPMQSLRISHLLINRSRYGRTMARWTRTSFERWRVLSLVQGIICTVNVRNKNIPEQFSLGSALYTSAAA